MPFDKILFENAPLEIIECNEDENYPKFHEFSKKGFCLFLNMMNVKDCGFNFDKTRFITKEKDESLNNGKLQRNDIVLTVRTNITNRSGINGGNVAFYGDDIKFNNIRINSDMVILRAHNNLLSKYLYYFLKSSYFKKQINQYKYGLPFPFKISKHLLKKFEFYFPPFNQQNAIVNFISQFDKKIDLYKNINKNLKKQLKAVYNSFFVKYDNFSQDDLKESEIGLIPKEWNLLYLGEVTEKIKEEVSNHCNFLATFRNGELLFSKNRFNKPIHGKNILIKKNEFTFNSWKINDFEIGRNDFNHDVCVRSYYIVFKVEEDYENFMNMYFKSSIFHYWSDIVFYESFKRKLSYDDFSKIKIAYPPKEIVDKFNQFYMDYYDMINYNNSAISILEKIRDILLNKLISGDLDVSKINNIKNNNS